MATPEENFYRVCHIVLDAIPTNLRDLFIQQWNAKYPDAIWDNSPTSGRKFIGNEKNRNVMMTVKQNMLHGDCKKFDGTTLFSILLNSSEKFLEGQPNVETNIKKLRIIRNECFAHRPNATFTDEDYQTLITDVKSIFQQLGWSITTICEIEHKSLNTLQSKQLENALISEDNRNKSLESRMGVVEVKVDVVGEKLKSTETTKILAGANKGEIDLLKTGMASSNEMFETRMKLAEIEIHSAKEQLQSTNTEKIESLQSDVASGIEYMENRVKFAEARIDLLENEKQAGGGFGDFPWNLFKQVEKIDHGASGTVFKVTAKVDENVYALKQTHVPPNEKDFERCKNEIKVISQLENPYIVKYFTSFQDHHGKLYIQMDFCGKGLNVYLADKEVTLNVVRKQARRLLDQLLHGIDYIHDKELIHRDLKPSNILILMIELKLNVKIGDFGLVSFQKDEMTSYTGTPLYRAPEQEFNDYDNKVDMFTLGVVMFEVLKKKYDISLDDWKIYIKKLRRNAKSILQELEPYEPKGWKQLISDLLEREPTDRPAAKYILENLNSILVEDTPKMTENPEPSAPVVSKILKKDITLDKSRWKLLPFNESFLSDEIEKLMKSEEKDVNNFHGTLSQKLCELKEDDIIKQEEKEQIPLPSDRIHLLESSNCLGDIRQQYKVQLEVKKEGLLITGEDSKIEKAKMFILMKLINVTSRSMKVSKGSYDFLNTKGGIDRAYGYLKHRNCNPVLTIIQNQNEISITALSSDEADRAISALRCAIHDKNIPLDAGTRELVQSEKGGILLSEGEQCYNVLIQRLDSSPSNLVIVGIDISEPERKLLDFLEQNTVRRKFITVKMGLIRFIFQYCRDQLKYIEKSLRDQLVTIQQSDGAILIKGTDSGLKKAVKQVKQVYSLVKGEIFISQRPGVRKLFQRAFIKEILLGMGIELSLVIISEADDIEKAVIEEEPVIKQKPKDAIGQTGCLCRFKTKAGKIISVYQGDITKHRVDIIVNPANANLRLLRGVAGAILSAGGNIIQDECDEYISEHGDLADGEVAITGAGKIECKKIIHAVGPHWREATNYIGQRELYNRQDTAKKALKMAINNTLIAARQYSSLAIPAVSSGIFGFPKPLCADILVSTVIEFCNKESGCNLNEIHFINNDTPTVKVFEQEFERKFKSQPGFTTFEHVAVKVDNNKQKRWRDIESGNHVESITPKKQPNDSENTEKKNVVSSSGNMTDTGSLSTPEGIAVELVVGDLSKQKVDVIVNTASSKLNLSSNPCASALSAAAGPALQAECANVVAAGDLSTWDIAKTKSGNLNCQSVYHAVCGNYDNSTGQSEQDLGVMVEKLLSKASKDNMESIAFPALATGALGFPRDTVARIMLDSVFKFSKSTSNTKLKKINFVTYDLDMQTVTAFQKEFTSRNNSAKTSSTADQATGSGEGDSRHRVRRQAKKPLSDDGLLSDDQSGYFCVSFDSLSVTLVNGDITDENTQAVVVIGNEDLDFGGAIGQAIVRKEGMSFKEQARKGSRQSRGTTQFIKTKHIPAKYIAHFVPLSIKPSYKDLLNSTSQMLHDAENHKLDSISIPAIGSGVLGFSTQESASIILQSIAKLIMSTKHQSRSFLRKIRIVIFEKHMLETFKEELIKILNSPEKYLENFEDGMGIIEWLKSLGQKVTGLIYPDPNRINSETGSNRQQVNTNRNSTPKEFDDVTFNIYSTEQRKIQEAKKRIEKIVDEHITPVSTKKIAFTKLSGTQRRIIEEKARQSDVSITFDADGTITIVGYHADTSLIMEYCNEVVMEKMEEDAQIQKGNLMAEIVQWVEVDQNKNKIGYDLKTNMKIEEAYNNGEKHMKLKLLDENDEEYTCELDLEAMTGKSENGSFFKLERIKKGGGISLPENWEAMPKDASGKEKPYHVVKLPQQSTEYQAVQKKVLDLSQGLVEHVIEIRQIQNPQLYKSFMARKETMDATRQNGSGERELFHGTQEASCEGINHHGLNRSLAGVNGTAYGVGVYFAVDSAYSARYAQQASPSGNRYMYLAKVLTGEFALGSSSYKTAPRKVGTVGSVSTDAYDTVVDNIATPRIFVTFFDNQCYPEYLIVFT